MNLKKLLELFNTPAWRFTLQVTVFIIAMLGAFAYLTYYAGVKGEELLTIEPRDFYLKDTVFLGEEYQALVTGFHNGVEEHHIREGVAENLELIVHPRITEDFRFSTLLSQTQKVWTRSFKHRKGMLYFFKQHYGFIVTKSILALIATAIGLMLAKSGWAEAKPATLSAFFIISGCVVFVHLLPDALQLDENVVMNKEKHVVHTNLGEQLYTFMGTGIGPNQDTMTVSDMILYTNGMMTKHMVVGAAFDESGLNQITGDIIERFQGGEEK